MVPRILIVDDNDDVLHLMSILVKVHYPSIDFTVARDGMEALAIAANGAPPAVVIIDITIPLLDGNQLCRILKHDYGNVVKTIVMTGNPDLIDAEFDAVLSKPFTRDELFAAIDAMLERRE